MDLYHVESFKHALSDTVATTTLPSRCRRQEAVSRHLFFDVVIVKGKIAICNWKLHNFPQIPVGVALD